MNEVILKPEGALSFETIAGLHENINQTLLSMDEEILVFDLSQVDKCDSAGLALLIDTVSQLKKRSLNYKFIGLSTDLISLAKFYEVETLLKDGF